MRAYELLFITYPDYDSDQVAAIISRYTDVITEANGKVVAADRWAKRRLAYEINGLREGLYILVTFAAEQAVCAEIDRRMKIDQDIVRHMISRLEHLPEPKEKPTTQEPKIEPDEKGPASVEVVAETSTTP